MKILIGCEESQVVCEQFILKGHDAMSCDIDFAGAKGLPHYQGDVMDIINDGWDMLIGFPPCTYLTYAGIRHWNNPRRLEKRLEALNFFAKLWLAPIVKICLENPRGCASPIIAKYSQLINPYYFGDSFSKPTCLYLKNLPQLIHTKTDNLFEQATHVEKGEFVEFVTNKGKIKKESKWFRELGGNSRERSKTFPGIAQAMANQWG